LLFLFFLVVRTLWMLGDRTETGNAKKAAGVAPAAW